jgi:rubredoxin
MTQILGFSRYRCPACGHIYDERRGNPREGYPSGTRWEAIPEDFRCPDCAVRDKPDFVKVDD